MLEMFPERHFTTTWQIAKWNNEQSKLLAAFGLTNTIRKKTVAVKYFGKFAKVFYCHSFLPYGICQVDVTHNSEKTKLLHVSLAVASYGIIQSVSQSVSRCTDNWIDYIGPVNSILEIIPSKDTCDCTNFIQMSFISNITNKLLNY